MFDEVNGLLFWLVEICVVQKEFQNLEQEFQNLATRNAFAGKKIKTLKIVYCHSSSKQNFLNSNFTLDCPLIVKTQQEITLKSLEFKDRIFANYKFSSTVQQILFPLCKRAVLAFCFQCSRANLYLAIFVIS